MHCLCFFKVNTFQCILATSEIESFVIFLYADLQWTTGDKSFGSGGLGGIEALAGYNAGNQSNSYTLVGSRTSKITTIARTSNVGIPGRWMFKLGQGKFKLYDKQKFNVIINIRNIHVLYVRRYLYVHICM